ncbi:unnamed protein product [Cyprideis torosa]|uniref:Uncharacterized protein n=1 Tax=Cyprideis torosa TaxID=163714 RepID=A0A7R8ZRG9_9CRUS|nr:unnamed protein product [Cyprideis torosa]CAG0905021.1 unnamed protein product [Cyprideis torosa]
MLLLPKRGWSPCFVGTCPLSTRRFPRGPQVRSRQETLQPNTRRDLLLRLDCPGGAQRYPTGPIGPSGSLKAGSLVQTGATKLHRGTSLSPPTCVCLLRGTHREACFLVRSYLHQVQVPGPFDRSAQCGPSCDFFVEPR